MSRNHAHPPQPSSAAAAELWSFHMERLMARLDAIETRLETRDSRSQQHCPPESDNLFDDDTMDPSTFDDVGNRSRRLPGNMENGGGSSFNRRTARSPLDFNHSRVADSMPRRGVFMGHHRRSFRRPSPHATGEDLRLPQRQPPFSWDRPFFRHDHDFDEGDGWPQRSSWDAPLRREGRIHHQPASCWDRPPARPHGVYAHDFRVPQQPTCWDPPPHRKHSQPTTCWDRTTDRFQPGVRMEYDGLWNQYSPYMVQSNSDKFYVHGSSIHMSGNKVDTLGSVSTRLDYGAEGKYDNEVSIGGSRKLYDEEKDDAPPEPRKETEALNVDEKELSNEEHVDAFGGVARSDDVVEVGEGITNDLVTGHYTWNNSTYASYVFDQMRKQNIFYWNTILSIYPKQGDVASMNKMFTSIPRKDGGGDLDNFVQFMNAKCGTSRDAKGQLLGISWCVFDPGGDISFQNAFCYTSPRCSWFVATWYPP